MASRDLEANVIIPVSQDQFATFISKLLGRPQKISRSIWTPFDVSRKDIVNLYHLIDQRIRQNNGNLIEFTARIYYDDRSSIELKSLEEFDTYREVRPLVSTGLMVDWIYLVQFPDSEVPEKQNISIKFMTEPQVEVHYYPPVPMVRNSIEYTIAHTSRTWGTDMESLLNGHIESLTIPQRGFRKFVTSHSVPIGFSAMLIFIVLATFGAVFAADSIANTYLSTFSSEVGNSANTIPQLSEQIKTLSIFAAKGIWHRFNFLQGVYFIFSLVASVIFGIWVGTTADIRQPSFLQMSDKAIQQREEMIKNSIKNWWHFGISGSVTLLAGVLSRVIFFYISKWWLG